MIYQGGEGRKILEYLELLQKTCVNSPPVLWSKSTIRELISTWNATLD